MSLYDFNDVLDPIFIQFTLFKTFTNLNISPKVLNAHVLIFILILILILLHYIFNI